MAIHGDDDNGSMNDLLEFGSEMDEVTQRRNEVVPEVVTILAADSQFFSDMRNRLIFTPYSDTCDMIPYSFVVY